MAAEYEIEVCRPGTFTPMEGEPVTFTAEQLATAAEVYDFENSPAPGVIGHPKTDDPAWCWAKSFRYDAEGQRLYATVADIVPAFADAVKSKQYRKISMSFFTPTTSANPKPGTWYPKHVGFLGAVAPAVPGLQPVTFAGGKEDAVEVVAFGDIGFFDVASLFRKLRDFLIEEHGLEKADAVLPSYTIDWLRERAGLDPSDFAAPAPFPNPEPEPVKTPTAAELAERERKLADGERALAEGQAKARHDENVAFCEGLIKQGRMLPKDKAENVALLDTLGGLATPAEVSFADPTGAAKKEPAVETLKRQLSAAPVQVNFSKLPREAPAGGKSFDFAVADGRTVDAADLDLCARAEAYQRQHPNTAWLDAVKAVS